MVNSLKLNQNIKTRSVILTGIFFLHSFNSDARDPRKYEALSFYVCAHQDDWQLFMGTNVINDINDFDETNAAVNGKKVVIIYTTAGNLHDDDDAKSCQCKDPYDSYKPGVPYWRVREKGAQNSIHLAACRIGGWGPGVPYPDNETSLINGHPVTRYEYKNTVSYYLRIKAGGYGKWANDLKAAAGTVDNSSVYEDWADFVNTLYYIYKEEMDSSLAANNVSFNFPDINENINPNDHNDHYLAGRGGCEAAKLLSTNMDTCYPGSLYIDYHTKNLPVNLKSPDVQNEAALTAVYCLALLDHNAWPEWGNIYHEWTNRNYFRKINTCESPGQVDILAEDSLDKQNVKIYPNPADRELFIKFNIPPGPHTTIKVTDMSGAAVYEFTGELTSDTFTINTRNFPNGSYLMSVLKDTTQLSRFSFEVIH